MFTRKRGKVASMVDCGNEGTVNIHAKFFDVMFRPVSSNGVLRIRDGFHQGLPLGHTVQESLSDWSRELGRIIHEGESTTLFNSTLHIFRVDETEANVYNKRGYLFLCRSGIVAAAILLRFDFLANERARGPKSLGVIVCRRLRS